MAQWLVVVMISWHGVALQKLCVVGKFGISVETTSVVSLYGGGNNIPRHRVAWHMPTVLPAGLVVVTMSPPCMTSPPPSTSPTSKNRPPPPMTTSPPSFPTPTIPTTKTSPPLLLGQQVRTPQRASLRPWGQRVYGSDWLVLIVALSYFYHALSFSQLFSNFFPFTWTHLNVANDRAGLSPSIQCQITGNFIFWQSFWIVDLHLLTGAPSLSSTTMADPSMTAVASSLLLSTTLRGYRSGWNQVCKKKHLHYSSHNNQLLNIPGISKYHPPTGCLLFYFLTLLFIHCSIHS